MKVSVSLDAELVGRVDRLAAREGTTRSAVMERWLQQGSQRAKIARLEEETAAYYDGLTAGEKEDDASWAAAAARAGRRLVIDDDSERPPEPRGRRLGRRRD